MAFKQFLSKARAGATKFFNTTLPSWKRNAQEGVRFYNTTIAPQAKNIHSKVKEVSESLQKDENISAKNKKRLADVSRFADIGLQKVNKVAEVGTKVSNALD
jgi:hypothetical protein